MLRKGAASKESKRRHFPTQHERRIESVHFRDTETEVTACIHSLQEELAVMEPPGPKAERCPSSGICVCSSDRSKGGTSWGVDRARGAQGADHRPAECWVAKSWNQNRDRGRFPLSERESRRNPKLQRHTAAQDHTSLVYDWDLLWHVIMALLQ